MSKHILFLSAIDFKERSIQVIRKTPESYVKFGWKVKYIVARDTSDRGNYSYEAIINPSGIDVQRFSWPLSKLRSSVKGRWPLYLLTRLCSFVVVIQIAIRAARELRKSPADVIYGYEVQGVLAVRLLRLFGRTGSAKIVCRFQGTWLTEMLEKRQIARIVANFDHVVALRTKCDLVIMTDDGTQGNVALAKFNPAGRKNLRFWVNGTDIPSNLADRRAFRQSLGISDTTIVLLSVSRLVRWKRLDRGIALTAQLHRQGLDFIYVIVGGGKERGALEQLAIGHGIPNRVKFIGPVPHSDTFNYMNSADFFISMYDLTNVGNPLLEAIRMGKIIVTLNNGDTGNWIRHMETGLIYDVNTYTPENASNDIISITNNDIISHKIRDNVKAISCKKLWIWDDRMKKEVYDVEQLLKS